MADEGHLYVKANTYYGTYLEPLEKHLIPYFGHMDLNKIRPIHVQNYINQVAEKYAPETLSDRRHQRLERSILAGSGHSAPLQSFDGEDLFPTDVEKIARAGFGLASNHAFLDGNKRISAMMVQLLLRWNGYQLRLEQGELADMFIAIADGTKGEKDLLQWIHAHIA